MYTREFLFSLKHLKYNPPESVIRFNELYIYAPKPKVHQPRVGHSKTRGTRQDFAQGIVSDTERSDLQRKRKDEKEKQAKKHGLTPQKNTRHPDGNASRSPESSKEQAESVEELSNLLQSILTDAQEQQACLVGHVPQDMDDCVITANKPEARSRIVRGKRPPNIETNERRLEQRRKQLSYGYATSGHRNYLRLVPKDKRQAKDPQTPNALQVCSKRSWDGQLAIWRKLLHYYDISSENTEIEDETPTKTLTSPLVTTEEREILARMRRESRQKDQDKKVSNAVSAVPTPVNTTHGQCLSVAPDSLTAPESTDPSRIIFHHDSFSCVFRVQVQVHSCH
jgi:hypothetical protein